MFSLGHKENKKWNPSLRYTHQEINYLGDRTLVPSQ